MLAVCFRERGPPHTTGQVPTRALPITRQFHIASYVHLLCIVSFARRPLLAGLLNAAQLRKVFLDPWLRSSCNVRDHSAGLLQCATAPRFSAGHNCHLADPNVASDARTRQLTGSLIATDDGGSRQGPALSLFRSADNHHRASEQYLV